MKQIMKRALWMLVCLMPLVCANAQTIVTVDGLQYSLSGAYASVYSAANDLSKQIIPKSIVYEGQTYTVNAVGNYAFCYSSSSYSSYSSGRYYYNQYVKEIILPNTITTIGSGAFYNSNITNVKLSDGVEDIRGSAFHGSSIISIIIPSSVISMHPDAFYNCDKLRTIVYLSATPPTEWTATSFTYVPSKKTYLEPSRSINNANVIEMISFSENTFTYTGKAPNVVWTNNMEGYTVNLAIPTLHSEVGTYEEVIPATFTSGEETFTAYIPYTYTIEPVKLTAKVNDASRFYGEDNPAFAINYTGFVNGEDEDVLTYEPIVSTTANASSAIGSYPITISGGKANNYTFEYEEGTLTVKKAPLSITVNDATKVYGTDNPTFSLSYAGLKNNETKPAWSTSPTFTTEATETSDVGTYAINVICEPKNYEATIKSGILNITQAPLIIGVRKATRPYCGKEPEYTFTYLGFVNGDDDDVLTQKPIIQTEATLTSNVGDYSITPAGAQAKNYDISYVSGTLNITQVPLTVRAVSETRNYGEANPDFSLVYEGFINNETEDVLLSLPTVSTSATFNSNVGTYDIRVSGGRAFNYTLKYESGQLVIKPVPLKISVGNYERPYNEANPRFELIYEGFVANDTEASLPSKPVVRTTATKTSDTGTYTLEVVGAYSSNYTITYQYGTLTVVKAEQTLEWEQDLGLLIVDDQIELKAVASSGLPVTYTMEEIDGAELYPAGRKTYLECKAPCEFVIKAVQSGNSNYFPTQRITKRAKIVQEDDYDKEKETAIEGVKAENENYAVRYNMNGQAIQSPQKGVNIIRYSDGTVKKVFVK